MENGLFVNYRDKGIPMNVIRSILTDHSGAVWIGGNEAVMRWQADTITTYTQKEGLPFEPIYDMMEDNEHTLWMGSYGGGLVRLKNGKFTRFTHAQGLFDEVIYQILEDNRRYLWMSGLKGVSCVSKQMLNDFAEGKIDRIQCTAYTTSDGMVSNECTGNVQSAGCKTSDNRLWFPTDAGIVVVDPNNIRENLLPPPVMIERVVLNKLDYSPHEVHPYSSWQWTSGVLLWRIKLPCTGECEFPI